MTTLSLGQRIIIGLAIMTLLIALLGAYSVRQMRYVTEINGRIVERDAEITGLLLRTASAQQQMRNHRDQAWQVYLVEKLGVPLDYREEVMRRWYHWEQETRTSLEMLAARSLAYGKNSEHEKRRVLWHKLHKEALMLENLLDRISANIREEFDGFRTLSVEQMAGRIQSVDKLRDQTTGDSPLLGAQQVVNELIAEGRHSVQETYRETLISVLTVCLLGLFSAIGITVWIRLFIMQPVRDFVRFITAVGTGDLTQRTTLSGSDILGTVGKNLNRMVEGLTDMTRQVISTTERIGSSAAELQAQAQQQSAAASEQNASIQQITSTIAEVSTSGAGISDRANQVASSGESAIDASHSGLEAAEQTVKAMVSIRQQAGEVAENIVSLTEKTRSIGEIIATVKDISERSNLLAFNASIEAAAAGEHGETFSVVAEEIKRLADQAKNATTQVRTLLEDVQQGISKAVMLTEEAVKRTESGEHTSESALSTIRQLVASVETSVNAFHQIMAATGQQQIGVQQVAHSVENIRETSEQTASGVAQLEEAAADMAAISDQLRTLVERYRL